MRYLVWLGLAAVLFSLAEPPLVNRDRPAPIVEAPVPVPIETFVGQTPREHSPAYQKWQEADHAFAVIDVALGRVWEIPDPREPLAELIRVAAEVDPVRACDRIREVSVRLQKRRLPPARRVMWDTFAETSAPQDRELRDALLRLSVAHASRSLAEPDIWLPDPIPRGAVSRGNERRLREFERQMLEYSIRLWKAILEQRNNRATAIELTTTLLTDAKKKGLIWLGCIGRTYNYSLAEDLANLDADLFLAVMSRLWKKEDLAQFCGSLGYRRWQDRKRDEFTGTLIKYGVENGVTRGDVIRVHSRYDFQRAWDETVRLGPPRLLITDLAWRDPDGALVVAENEPNKLARRGLTGLVAKVWAYKKPAEIERTIKNLENEVERSYVRELARVELEWRKQGNPPRDTPETMPDPFRHQLEKPAGTPWIPPPALQTLMNDPKRSVEADQWLHIHAQSGPPDHAVQMVKRIQSPQLLTNSATWVARGLIRRSERD